MSPKKPADHQVPNMKTDPRQANRPTGMLILVFAVLTVGISVIGYISYWNYERDYRIEVERQLSAIAELKVGELVQYRKERLGDASIATRPTRWAACSTSSSGFRGSDA